MSTFISVQLLSELPLFKGLSRIQLESLLGFCQMQRLRCGEHVRLGDSGNCFGFVVSGSLAWEEQFPNGEIVTRQGLCSDDFFGELCLFGGSFDGWLRARSDVVVILIKSDVVKRVLLETTEVMERMMAHCACVIQRQQELRKVLSIQVVHERLLALLTLLSIPQRKGGVRLVHVLPRQHELAAMLNTSRESISRAMSTLLKKGILQREGDGFWLWTNGSQKYQTLHDASVGAPVVRQEKSLAV